jgi:hypothetical protein
MTPTRPKPLLSFVSDRALGLFGLLIGVIGLVLTVIIYFISIAEPALTIVVNPARTSILKSGETTKLRVQFDGIEVRGNLAAAQIYVWNAGRKAIRSDEILEPIVIRTTDGSRILETQLTTVSRKVNGITVSPVSGRPDSVQLNFEVLERYDGAVLNIIYEGDSKVGFT